MGKVANSRTGNSRGENKTPCGGMVVGGNRNQRREGSGNRGHERKITWFAVPVATFTARIPGKFLRPISENRPLRVRAVDRPIALLIFITSYHKDESFGRA